MNTRIWWAARGVDRVAAFGFLACVVAGTALPVLAVRIQTTHWASTDDMAWSAGFLAACVSWVICASWLVDRLPTLTATCARWPWCARLAGLAAACATAAWPALWGLVGAPARVVGPTVALGLAVVGAGAVMARLREWFAIAPAVTVAAVAMMPGVLPQTVHPFTPSLHPTSVVVAQLVVAVVGCVVYPCPPLRMTRRVGLQGGGARPGQA